jgi:hypothetical protein
MWKHCWLYMDKAFVDSTAFYDLINHDRVIVSFYMGGSGNDNFRSCAVGSDGSFVIVGSTNSRDWLTKNAMQPTFGGGSVDIIVVKFSPENP